MSKRAARTEAEPPPPWERKAPKTGGGKALSPRTKAKAKKAAKAAGRPYPNLVDNMRAASEQRQRRRPKKA